VVLVDVGDKIVKRHPTMLLGKHSIWLLGWLLQPPDGISDFVKAVA
jgi:hypothetical protein